MAWHTKKPVTVAGIEFDALISHSHKMTSTIPMYPVEDGYSVSDTIINDPVSIDLTLYVSETPVTWLYRHGTANGRVKSICEELEELWESKELVKIVTPSAVYTDMGITSLTISHTQETGYAREVSLSATKVVVTTKRLALIPSYVLQSGTSEASAGTATTSTQSATSSTTASNGTSGSTSDSSDSTGSESTESSASKASSILYGVASGLGFI